MAIFSRRTLQRLINENASFLTKKQTRKHVDGLNAGDLSVEWEVVVLNVFSKLGIVKHEEALNGKRPDLLFETSDPDIGFLSDIKTVSDEGIETNNPVDAFTNRLSDEILKTGVGGHWNYEIGGTSSEARLTGEMIRLKLPALSRFDSDIFNSDFTLFIEKIIHDSTLRQDFKIKTDTVDIEISYEPSKEATLSGGYPSFKEITAFEHLIRNSVYRGLQDKAHQLKECKYDGMKGIILCDGGSYFLKRSKRIIDEFFQMHPYINFVIAFSVEQFFGYNASAQIKVYFEEDSNLNPKLRDFLDLLHTLDVFPYPKEDAINAKVANEQGNFIFKGWGKMILKGYEITLSARTALNLLGGQSLTKPPKEHIEFFERMKNEGLLIVGIDFEKGPEEIDDDLITLRFGSKDAAISAFQIPN